MQQVRQGLGVHQSVFDRDVENHFFWVLPITRRGLRTILENVIDSFADAQIISFDLRKLRPVGRLVFREAAIHRIDAESKEVIKFLVRSAETQCVTRDQIPIECFEVADIEDDSVPLRNGPVIKRVRSHHPKQVIGHRP
jgi:hypothetical protein